MATCNIPALLQAAKCFGNLSKKELLAITAQLLCNLIETEAGWPAGSAHVYYGAYGAGGDPGFTPPAGENVIAYNTFDETWVYWDTTLSIWIPVAVPAPIPDPNPNPPVMYDHLSDPNTLGLTPLDSSKPCVAYSDDGSGAIYGWNAGTGTWV